MSDFKKHLNKKLKNSQFHDEWAKSELRYVVIKQLIQLRNEQNMTQSEFSKKIGTTQAVISRVENATVNIGIDFLEKVAKAFDKRVEFEIV